MKIWIEISDIDGEDPHGLGYEVRDADESKVREVLAQATEAMLRHMRAKGDAPPAQAA